jgi:aminomethyltransferase
VAGEKEVGRVTSAVVSPALGRPIALGYVHRDFVEPGAAVAVLHGGARLGATVAALPFVPGG